MIFILDVESYMYRQLILDEMIDFCETNSILSFCELLDYVSHNRYDDWLKVLASNGGTKYMVKYFKRKNHFIGHF